MRRTFDSNEIFFSSSAFFFFSFSNKIRRWTVNLFPLTHRCSCLLLFFHSHHGVFAMYSGFYS
ncbi:hypothetical protein V8C40DRAFT_49065 [Trichoderma camerunense]